MSVSYFDIRYPTKKLSENQIDVNSSRLQEFRTKSQSGIDTIPDYSDMFEREQSQQNAEFLTSSSLAALTADCRKAFFAKDSSLTPRFVRETICGELVARVEYILRTNALAVDLASVPAFFASVMRLLVENSKNRNTAPQASGDVEFFISYA